jgi:hypothetical protein
MLYDKLAQHYADELRALQAAGYQAEITETGGGVYVIAGDIDDDRYYFATNGAHGGIAAPEATHYRWDVGIYEKGGDSLAIAEGDSEDSPVEALRDALRVFHMHRDREFRRVVDVCWETEDRIYELSTDEARVIAQAYGWETQLERFGAGADDIDIAEAIREVEWFIDSASVVRDPGDNHAYIPGAMSAFICLREYFRNRSDAEILEAVKAEFLEGVLDGIFPPTVTSFNDLHDHTDANMIADELTSRRARITQQSWSEFFYPIEDKFTEWLATDEARKAIGEQVRKLEAQENGQ